MVLSLLHTAALAVDKTVSTEEELKQAIESVSDGDTITVSGTIEVNAPLVVTHTITLTGGSIVASNNFTSNSNQLADFNLMSSKQGVCYRDAMSRKVLILLRFLNPPFYIVE